MNKKECKNYKKERCEGKDEKAPLCLAVLKRNVDIVQRLLLCEDLNVNITTNMNILTIKYLQNE